MAYKLKPHGLYCYYIIIVLAQLINDYLNISWKCLSYETSHTLERTM